MTHPSRTACRRLCESASLRSVRLVLRQQRPPAPSPTRHECSMERKRDSLFVRRLAMPATGRRQTLTPPHPAARRILFAVMPLQETMPTPGLGQISKPPPSQPHQEGGFSSPFCTRKCPRCRCDSGASDTLVTIQRHFGRLQARHYRTRLLLRRSQGISAVSETRL